MFRQNHDFSFFIQCINTIKKVNRKEIEESRTCVRKSTLANSRVNVLGFEYFFGYRVVLGCEIWKT